MFQEYLQRIKRKHLARSVFQPIFDSMTGRTVAYEMLARVPEFENPEQALLAASEDGMLCEFEFFLFQTAVEAFKPWEHLEECSFFVNLSPQTFVQPWFFDEALKWIREIHHISPRRVVFEMTERSVIDNYNLFSEQVKRFNEQGIRIAIDDLGIGHSNLVTMVSASPHFIKLDRSLIQNIHADSYKQKLVKSLVEFVSSVDSRFIAEGVERWEEMDFLLRTGVRYFQGFLLGRPDGQPKSADSCVVAKVKSKVSELIGPKASVFDKIGRLVYKPRTIQVNHFNGEALSSLFKKDCSIDHVVILNGETPEGLITQDHLERKSSGPFGYSLIQKKMAEEFSKKDFLVAEEDYSITDIGQLAMDRPHPDTYDPVVITNKQGEFVGTVTMKHLLQHTLKLEVQRAHNANPLTNLPGNRMIQSWIEQALQHPPFTLVYADLDRFKAFNDCYGFLKGDDFIVYTADQLNRALIENGIQGHVGHVGGDDFVIIAQHQIEAVVFKRICEIFDRDKANLFPQEDYVRGFFAASNREGKVCDIPLTTLSLAIITHENITDSDIHVGKITERAASVKKALKQRKNTASDFLFDRRIICETSLIESRFSRRNYTPKDVSHSESA